MAKAKKSIEETGVEALSMEEILQSIRGVISEEDPSQDDSDILELTDIIEESAVLPEGFDAGVENFTEYHPVNQEKSILDDIDAALDENPTNNVETTEVIYATSTNDNRTPNTDDDYEQGLEISTENFIKDTSSQARNSTGLLDEQAIKLSSVSLKEFVNTIQNKQVDSPHTRSGTSLEDIVIEAMKPFLADWLNKNLPIIVRKVVEKEVKRLIPKDDED